MTGKGGVGKTTLAGMAVRWLAERDGGAVLAVDADPNTCLDALLGVKCGVTVGGVREQARTLAQEQSTSAGGMGKTELLDMKIQEALVESDKFDLIAMGRPEGPGCYCYANNVLRGVLSRLAKQYPAVVIDNEAGLENLSRRTVQYSDWLLFMTDASARGLATAQRLHELARELGVKSGAIGLVINRARNETCVDAAERIFQGTDVHVLGAIPEDEQLALHDSEGLPVWRLPQTNPALQAAFRVFEKIYPGAAAVPTTRAETGQSPKGM